MWLIGGATALSMVGSAALQLFRLPPVWRGERVSSLPWPNMHGPEVNHRSFPAFCGFSTCLGIFAAVFPISIVVDHDGLAAIAVAVAVLGFVVFVPPWILVNAINRPRFLVPPSRRSEPGGWPVAARLGAAAKPEDRRRSTSSS